MYLTFIICLLWVGTATAQTGKERKEAAEKKAAEERLRSQGGFRVVDSTAFRPQAREAEEERPDDERQSNDSDSSAAAGDQKGGGEQHQFTEKTTSGSGSPSVLSAGNGRERDGTGNVQRATPNMVGSPVSNNLRLEEADQNPSSKSGGQVRDQQDRPQQSATGAKGTKDDKNSKDKPSGNNEKRRARKNN